VPPWSYKTTGAGFFCVKLPPLLKKSKQCFYIGLFRTQGELLCGSFLEGRFEALAALGEVSGEGLAVFL